jgi:hypothetical protein
MALTVAVVSAIYGDDYDCFVYDWQKSIKRLNRAPDEVVLHRGFAHGELHPWGRIMNEAIAETTTDWIFPLGVDDMVLPDGLDGIDEVESDVWLMGYEHLGGARKVRTFIPTALPNDDYLASARNVYPGLSCFRRSAWERVGGYPIISHEDWGFWRRLARAGATFSASGRVQTIYRDHPGQRSKAKRLAPTEAREERVKEVLADA